MRVIFLFTLLPILFLCSCQKEIHFPETNPPASTKINIHYKPLHAASANFELIIADSANEVMLDTVLSVNQDHSVSFGEGPYSLTTIEYDDTEKKYKSKTYLNAQATGWLIQPIDDKQNLGSTNISSGADAKLMYQNVPPFTGFIFYSGSQFQTGSTVSVTPMASQNKIEISYKRLDKYIAYLMIPSIGKYKIHQTNSANDIADCAQMDDAVKINYTKPANLTYSYIDLFGFLNTDNYNNGIQLFHSDPVIFGDDFDLVYPDKGISKYFFYGLFGDSDGGQFVYNNLGDEVPQDLEFLDKSYFDVVSNQQTGFEIEFLKEEPSFYYVVNNSAKLHHVIYAAPDQTTINTPKLVSALAGSEFLEGENLDYKLSQVAYHQADDYSYSGYFNFIYNPSASGEKVKRSRTYILPLP